MIIKTILYLILVIYLFFLSCLDIKYRKLEYWQTGLLYPISIAIPLYLYIIKDVNIKRFILNLVAAVAAFLFILAFSMFKNKMAFGGADLWIVGALGLVFGIVQIWEVILVACLACCIYALFYRIIKKKKEHNTPFVPFLTIGALINIVLFC